MNGRTALVTGATGGIGAAIAARFGELGARVLAPARAQLDLGSAASIAAYAAALAEPVDILVNCAGVNVLGGLEEVTDERFADIMSVNLEAPLRLCRALAPQMAARGYGRIVNVSSIWSVVGKPRRLAYTVSKAGLNGLTAALAVEFAGRGVLVNAVAPGIVRTELTQRNNSPAEIAELERQVPLGRLAEPAEVADVITFLCSARNSYLTGQVIVCDGGFTIV